MKIKLSFIFTLALALVILSACNQGPKPIEISSLDKIVEPNYKYEISIPSNWQNSKSSKRVASFSNKETSERFRKYDATGFPGAKVDLEIATIDSSGLEGMIAKKKAFSGEAYSAPIQVTIDGIQVTKLAYSFPLDDGDFDGEMYVGTKDNKTATIINFGTFAGTKDKYKDKFAEIIKSIKLAITPEKKEGDVVINNIEATPASKKLKAISGTGFSVSIPDNFKTEAGGAKALFSKRYIGERRGDCYLQVDVIDSKRSNNLKNIADGTKNAVKGGDLKETKFGGQTAYFFSYNPAKEVNGRIYFALKNDNLYRFTINWFKGEEADYLPVFEEVIKSFNIK
jgi:hypothetical protein